MYHKLFRDALHPWKWCIAKGCISVYWRACRWYYWTGLNSAKLLSSTCSTANISVAMVDSSLLKLMYKLFRDALCIHVSVDGYLWSGFNNAELSTVATLTAPYGGICKWDWRKLITTFGFVMVGRILLNTIYLLWLFFSLQIWRKFKLPCSYIWQDCHWDSISTQQEL